MLKEIKTKHGILKFNRTLIQGILNVTPDSFFDGGINFIKGNAVKNASQMIADGADIIDIGGESSMPGSEPVSANEELRRILPVIKKLRGKLKISIPISVDTCKPEVADECINAGADIINDINGLRNNRMVKVAAKHKVPVIIMHMQGTPKTMQVNPRYKNVVNEIMVFFREQIVLCERSCVKDIILDPGIGFGKNLEHNLEIIRNISEFKKLGKPILLGVSRKSFLGQITGLPVEERLEATISAVVACVLNGANIVRVHDVKECRRALMVADEIIKN